MMLQEQRVPDATGRAHADPRTVALIFDRLIKGMP
jgi:hypothetical protein